MIRVISPMGKLFMIGMVQPICEKMVSFNGENVLMMDIAKDFSVKPTALAMEIVNNSGTSMSVPYNDELFVGNLRPELVVEIIRTLGKEEYFDFSVLDYQKAIEPTLDEGESGPYNSEDVPWTYGKNFCCNNTLFSNARPYCLLNEPELFEYKCAIKSGDSQKVIGDMERMDEEAEEE